MKRVVRSEVNAMHTQYLGLGGIGKYLLKYTCKVVKRVVYWYDDVGGMLAQSRVVVLCVVVGTKLEITHYRIRDLMLTRCWLSNENDILAVGWMM